MGVPARHTTPPPSPSPLTADERARVLRLMEEWKRRAADDAASEPDWDPDALFATDRPR